MKDIRVGSNHREAKGRRLGIGRYQPSMQTEIERHVEESHPLNEEWLEASLNLIELTGVTDREFVGQSLKEAIRLTGSRIGYLHFVRGDQEHLELFTWTKEVLEVCTVDKAAHHPLSHALIWTDCLRTKKPVIHNDCQNSSDNKGYSEGHIHIVRHMSIPLIDDKKIIAIAGVVNKEEPYDQSDVRCLSLFMNCMWCLLKRKRIEEKNEQLVAELQHALDKIKTLGGLIPICSSCKRIRDDQGHWNQLESYLHEHTSADFTHGICPECKRRLYQHVDIS
ncbi:MAG: GAF domain-containing protein [Fidelibacterota bacterium]|nr:MAG: GAF domain-containing protein [Candidatus Neomarinimicrobiota bacterium]